MHQVMEESTRRWMIKQAVKHYWRISNYMEISDLIQDGHLHFQRLALRYPDVKDKPQVMALFKRTFINHIHDISKKQSRQSADKVEELAARKIRKSKRPLKAFDWEHLPLDSDSSDPELATFRVFLAKAPKPVQDVISLLIHDETRKAIRAQYRIRRDGTRETVNERLTRLIGLDPSIDVAGMVRSYLCQD